MLYEVITGAAELFDMNYMRGGDSISMDLDRLIGDAKKKVLALATNYRPKRPAENLPAPGRGIAGSIKSQLWNMKMGGFITEYRITSYNVCYTKLLRRTLTAC